MWSDCAPCMRKRSLSHGVVGLIIGTRPDCIPDVLLDYLESLSRRCFVLVEYGAETSHNSTLALINRCHTWEQTVDAVTRTMARGIHVGLHFKMGLPGETVDMMLQSVDALSRLPVDTVKFHQLQIIRGTRLARDIEKGLYDVPRMTGRGIYRFVCKDCKAYQSYYRYRTLYKPVTGGVADLSEMGVEKLPVCQPSQRSSP